MRVCFCVFFCAFSVSACDPDVRTYERDDVTIHHLNVGIGNVWALEGTEGTVLVDLGEKGDLEDTERALDFIGIGFDGVTLAVLTHGHMDHLGPAKAFQDEAKAPVAMGEKDAALAEAGFSEPPKSQIWEGEALRPLLDKSFPAFTPDLALDLELDLHPFGVPGRVTATPGHTEGSLSVILESGDVFVGDLIRGDREGEEHQGFPTTHFFSADPDGDVKALQGLIEEGGAFFYPGHGPYFDRASLEGWIVDRKQELDEQRSAY